MLLEECNIGDLVTHSKTNEPCLITGFRFNLNEEYQARFTTEELQAFTVVDLSTEKGDDISVHPSLLTLAE